MQSLEQEMALGACLSISETVRNSEKSTKVLFLILELQEQTHVGTSMYQMVNFKDAHAFTNCLISTYSHLKWEFLN